MVCPHCNNEVKPGMELTIRPEQPSHCPYCLHRLADGSGSAQDVSVRRFTLRREARERFADALVAASTDGEARCPVCDHGLTKSSLLLLRNSEHFQCGYCSRDLADEAYRREAYLPQPWLSLVTVLADLRAEEGCKRCPYFQAAAQACQEALSWIPENHGKQAKLLASLTRHPDTELPPEGGCLGTCGVIERYRATVGDRLLLL